MKQMIPVRLAGVILAVLLPVAAWSQEKLSTIGVRLLPALEVPVGADASSYGLGGSGTPVCRVQATDFFPPCPGG